MATIQTNSKIKLKPVHFNLDNPIDLELFNKANTITNFTQWVKDQLNEEKIQSETLNRDNIRNIIKEIINETSQNKQDINLIEKIDSLDEKPNLLQQKNKELDSMIM